MKRTILAIAILLVSSSAHAQYGYPGPPIGTWRNPDAGPNGPSCIENGYCGPVDRYGTYGGRRWPRGMEGFQPPMGPPPPPPGYYGPPPVRWNWRY